MRKPAAGLALALVAMAATGASAQVNHAHNEVGIYAVENPDGCAEAQIAAPAMSVFTCYMVLTNPWNETLDQPATSVTGCEFRLGIPADVFVLGDDLPPCPTCFVSPPDYYVSLDKPVIDGHSTLIAFTVSTATDQPRFLSLGPVQDGPASIPGAMAFTDGGGTWPDNLFAMVPVSGSPDVPVFAINWDGELSFCETVPDEGISFGNVKALYR